MKYIIYYFYNNIYFIILSKYHSLYIYKINHNNHYYKIIYFVFNISFYVQKIIFLIILFLMSIINIKIRKNILYTANYNSNNINYIIVLSTLFHNCFKIIKIYFSIFINIGFINKFLPNIFSKIIITLTQDHS